MYLQSRILNTQKKQPENISKRCNEKRQTTTKNTAKNNLKKERKKH